jgi:hypothetical protein
MPEQAFKKRWKTTKGNITELGEMFVVSLRAVVLAAE